MDGKVNMNQYMVTVVWNMEKYIVNSTSCIYLSIHMYDLWVPFHISARNFQLILLFGMSNGMKAIPFFVSDVKKSQTEEINWNYFANTLWIPWNYTWAQSRLWTLNLWTFARSRTVNRTEKNHFWPGSIFWKIWQYGINTEWNWTISEFQSIV